MIMCWKKECLEFLMIVVHMRISHWTIIGITLEKFQNFPVYFTSDLLRFYISNASTTARSLSYWSRVIEWMVRTFAPLSMHSMNSSMKNFRVPKGSIYCQVHWSYFRYNTFLYFIYFVKQDRSLVAAKSIPTHTT